MRNRNPTHDNLRDTIIETLSRNLPKIVRFGIQRIGIFGSVVKGEVTPNSDIDILIEFKDGQETFDNLMDLHLFLKEILGDERRIDLVTRGALSPYIGPYILKEVQYIEAVS